MSRIALLVIVLMAPLVLAGGSVEMPGEEVTQIATTTVMDNPKEKSSSPVSLPVSYSSAKSSRKVPNSGFQHGTGPFIYAGFIEQRRIAKAAEGSVDIVWWQNWINSAAILISMVGIALLGWTLLETRRATKTGLRAAKAAESVVMQNRAYMTPGAIRAACLVNRGRIKGFTLEVPWKNTGLSPAINVRVFLEPLIISSEKDLKEFNCSENIKKETLATVGSGDDYDNTVDFTQDEVGKSVSKDHLIIIYTVIEYSDLYGKKYIAESTSKVIFKFDPYNISIKHALPTSRKPIGTQQGERLFFGKQEYIMNIIKLQEGITYVTRRGDAITDLKYNKFGDDEPENYTGTMVYSDGQRVACNWREDGVFLGNGFEPCNREADIVKEIDPK